MAECNDKDCNDKECNDGPQQGATGLLPATAAVDSAETPTRVTLNETTRLDALGPVVVNPDGTLSRITNWHTMGPAERAVALRRIVKRNRERLAALSTEQDAARQSTE